MSALSHNRSEQQHLALDRANEIRLARAELRRRIASGEVTVASVLLEVPAEAESWAVADVIRAQRRWGRQRAMKLLARNRVSEVKPVGKLTERQRQILAAALSRSA